MFHNLIIRKRKNIKRSFGDTDYLLYLVSNHKKIDSIIILRYQWNFFNKVYICICAIYVSRLNYNENKTIKTVSRIDVWQEQVAMDKTRWYFTTLIFSHILILRRTYILPQAGTNCISPFNVEHIHLTITYSGDMEILMQNIPSNVRYTFPRICLWE